MTSGAVQSSKACPGPDPGFKVPGYGLGTRNAELGTARIGSTRNSEPCPEQRRRGRTQNTKASQTRWYLWWMTMHRRAIWGNRLQVVTDGEQRESVVMYPITVQQTLPRTEFRCDSRMAGTRGVCAPHWREGRSSNDSTLKNWR